MLLSWFWRNVITAKINGHMIVYLPNCEYWIQTNVNSRVTDMIEPRMPCLQARKPNILPARSLLNRDLYLLVSQLSY